MARTKGSKNRKSYDAYILASKLGIDPLEVLLKFAMNDWKALGYPNETYSPDGKVECYFITPETRVRAAKEACEYLYSKTKSVELLASNSDQDHSPRVIIQIPSNNREVKTIDIPAEATHLDETE